MRMCTCSNAITRLEDNCFNYKQVSGVYKDKVKSASLFSSEILRLVLLKPSFEVI